MKCGFCGAENPADSSRCSVCMRDLGGTSKAPKESFRRTPEFHPRTQRMIPRTKTVLPVAAGGILIIDAVSCLAGLLVANAVISEYYPEESDAAVPALLFLTVLALFVLLGGCLAAMRRGWGIAVASSVVAFFLVLMFGFLIGVVGAMLSVATLILLIQSRHEFAGHAKAD